MPTQRDFEMLRALPLETKIFKTKLRIRDWMHHWGRDNVYVSFSGGADSLVVLNLVRQEFPKTEAVFINTGLEFPEIYNFIKTIENVTTIKAKMTFPEVIEKYGYPIISKDVSEKIEQYRNTKNEVLKDKRWNNKIGKIPERYKFLIDAPFKISSKCCFALKKAPIYKYERQIGKHPILGTIADESVIRRRAWIKNGCNAFENVRPVSTPIAFWTKKDIWDYIEQSHLDYCDIYKMGYNRSGCCFCLMGIQNPQESKRLIRLKNTHPHIYKYIMEQLHLNEIIDEMNKSPCIRIQY